MIHLHLILDTRRTKKDGTHPIVFRITSKGQTRDIATGYSCTTMNWDSKLSIIKSKDRKTEILNQRLHDREFYLHSKIREFELKFPEEHNPQRVKDYISGERINKISLLEFWKQEIERMNAERRYGNARNYKCAMTSILRHKRLDIRFEDVDFKWLSDLETRLRSTGLKTNSISMYFRHLRSIYNRAINHQIVDSNAYPFRRYKIRSEQTEPRSITVEELRRFFAYRPDPNHQTFHAWNYGKLIFLLRGINFFDLALLTNDNIKDGRIIYKRHKTGKPYSVAILSEVENIMNEYKGLREKPLLPILTDVEYETLSCYQSRIAQQRKTTNKWLKLVGKDLNIKEPLSSYVFRYSHANICKQLGYSKDLISESLGHGYGLAVSSCYLEDYNLDLIDEMNHKVVKYISDI